MKKELNNWVFIIIIVIAIAFFLSPLLLKVPIIHLLVSNILSEFSFVEYKTAYINTVGALLGTFLAVSGALFTQQREHKKNDIVRKQKIAIAIKTELRFILNSLLKFESAYACIKPGTKNNYDDLKYFIKYKKDIYIEIDTEWRNKIAEIYSVLSYNDIEQLYKIYMDLSLIESICNKDERLISKKEAYTVYKIIYRDLADLTIAPKIEIKLKKENEDILEKLDNLSN